MENKLLKFKEIQNRINGLYLRTHALLYWYKEYKNLYYDLIPSDNLAAQNYYKNNLIKLLPFFGNLLFADVILNINTLLSKYHKNDEKKELSLYEYIDSIETDKKIIMQKKIDEIVIEFDKCYLNIIRNKIIGHKDLYTSGDPDSHFFTFYDEEYINQASSILDMINLVIIKYFNNIPVNNYFKNYFDESHNIFLEMVKQYRKM